MPRQNRVTPAGDIIAHPARGLFMGNRGLLHDAAGHLGVARWRHRAWVTCVLDFKGRRRPIMAPGHYTELFFLDEAVALAAGHRPCGECRRERHGEFQRCWCLATGAHRISAPAMDSALHQARVDPRSKEQRRSESTLDGMPDGAFVTLPDDERFWLVLGDCLLPFAGDGYGPPRGRPTAFVTVLTPRPTIAVLQAGYRPSIHHSAFAEGVHPPAGRLLSAPTG